MYFYILVINRKWKNSIKISKFRSKKLSKDVYNLYRGNKTFLEAVPKILDWKKIL